MAIPFRLLTEADVKAVLDPDELLDALAAALQAFSAGQATQPLRTIIPVSGDEALVGTMPAFVPGPLARQLSSGNPGALGAKLVSVFAGNAARGLPTHLASIVLLDARTGALLALMDGRYITEARTAAVSALSSRALARRTAASLAIIGSGVQAASHLSALRRVHRLRQVAVWSPSRDRRERFAHHHGAAGLSVKAADYAGEAIVGADVIVLATSATEPVLENGWVKPGAHVISVGACRPSQREIDPALVARARLVVDSRAAALAESGDIAIGIREGRFGPDHIAAELGEILAGAEGRRRESDITLFKSVGMAVEDVAAADLAYRRAVERGVGQELTL